MKAEMKLRLTLVSSLVSSVSILLIPLMKNALNVRAAVVPLIFWAGLAAEQIMFVSFKKSVSLVNSDKEKKGRVGAISFFKSKEGRAADIVFIVSLAALTVVTAVQRRESVIQYILIFAAVLSLTAAILA